ncbi:MAG: TetR/AcrR family transcriptional regulator [Clostridiaceae bacterium]
MKEKTFQRKAEVIQAALDEFITNDYEKASLNTIIKVSGISKGTFYYHFKNKEALYIYLLKSGVEAKWSYINSQIAEDGDNFDASDIFDKFLYQARQASGFAVKYPKYFKLNQMFSKEKSNPIYGVALEVLGGDSTDIIEVMIEDAFNKKEFSSEYEKAFIVKLLSHLLLEFDQVFDDVSDYEKEKATKNLEDYVRFMRYGLQGQKKQEIES